MDFEKFFKENPEHQHQDAELQNYLYRENLSAFVRPVFRQVLPGDRFISNWHVDCLCDYLTAVERGEIKRIIINIQPRSLKSIISSVSFPAWLLARNPHTRIICASYGRDLAGRFSRWTRDVIESDWYKAAFPDTVIKKDQNEKAYYELTQGGFRLATSVGATITGTGGHYLIIDDPQKPSEGTSEAKREETNTWFDGDLYTRKDSMDTRILVITNRVHDLDLTGHLLGKGTWEQLKIPTIATKKTIIEIRGNTYTRKIGDLLNPILQTKEFLDTEKAELGEYQWAGQFQQEPAPLGGGEFKEEWINNLNVNATGMNKYLLVDPAGKKRKESDYTAMWVIGCAWDKNYYILDIVRDKLNLIERKDKVFELVDKWKVLKVGYETYGIQADIEYIQEQQKLINFQFKIIPLGGTKISKEDRIRRLIPLFHDERIILPEPGFYVKDYTGASRDLVMDFIEDEYLPFPKAKHDDMMDGLSRMCDEEFKMVFPSYKPVKVKANATTESSMYL